MADQDARALLLTIQANTELLRSNLSAAERAVEEFTRNTQQHLDEQDAKFEVFGKSLEKLEGPLERLKSLGEFAIGALLGESLIEAGKKGLEFAGNVKFVSEQVGTSTQFLQQYRYAAGQFGVSTELADTGLQKFARSIGEAANGNKQLIELFDRLGVKVRDNEGHVRSVEAVYLDTANAISKIDNPAQKAADTLQLMGRGASGLVPLLASGAAGFNQLAQAAEQLGIVLSPELIEHSEEVNHKLAALKQVIDAQMSSAIASNAGNILAFATAIEKLATAFAKLQKEHPEASMEILGATIGAKFGGLPGAVAGGVAGAVGGKYLSDQEKEESTDLGVRRQEFDHAFNHFWSLQRLASATHGSVGGGDDLKEALDELQHQRQLYVKAAKLPHAPEGGHGSDEAGGTNENGDALKNAQSQVAELEKAKAGASGAALTAIKDEIAERKREIGFLKQGVSAQLASSLASKTGAAEKSAENKAKEDAKKAEEQRLKALANDRAFFGQLEQYQSAYAKAQLGLSDTAKARYAIEIEELRAAQIAKAQQIDDQLAAGKISEAEAVVLRNLLSQTEQASEAVALRKEQAAIAKEKLDLDTDDLQRQQALLQIQESFATTAKQRRDIELRLLALQEQAEREALENQRDHATNQAEKDRATAALGALSGQYDARRQAALASTRGPGEQYLHDLNGRDINEELEGVKVSGLDTLSNGLTGIISGTQSVSRAFTQMASSIIADLARIAIEQAIIKPIANSLFGGLNFGSQAAGLEASTSSLLSASNNAGFASISSSFFGHADGGHITGPGTGRSDSIFARLSNGEFVVNADATRRNLPLLHAINDNRISRFADGGFVGTRAIIPARVPDMAVIGANRAAAVQPIVVKVEANDYFDAKVSGIAGQQIQQAAPQIAAGGAQLAGINQKRAERRRLS